MRVSRKCYYSNKNQFSLFDWASQKTNYITVDYEADYVRRRYLLPIHTASVVAELAGLGGYHE